MRNIVKEKPEPKGNGCQGDTPLKSFELFFDDAMITDCDMDYPEDLKCEKQLHKQTWIFVQYKRDRNSRTHRHPAVLGRYKELQRKYCKHLGKRWYWQANLHGSEESEAFFVSCVLLML